jgi:hypothetical protein
MSSSACRTILTLSVTIIRPPRKNRIWYWQCQVLFRLPVRDGATLSFCYIMATYCDSCSHPYKVCSNVVTLNGKMGPNVSTIIQTDRPLRADLSCEIPRRQSPRLSNFDLPPPASSPLLQLLRLHRCRYCVQPLELANKDGVLVRALDIPASRVRGLVEMLDAQMIKKCIFVQT